MNFEEMLDRADRAAQRIEKILNTALPDKDDDSYAMKLSILTTMIDCLAIEHGRDPVEEKRTLADLGKMIEVLCKWEADEHDPDRSI